MAADMIRLHSFTKRTDGVPLTIWARLIRNFLFCPSFSPHPADSGMRCFRECGAEPSCLLQCLDIGNPQRFDRSNRRRRACCTTRVLYIFSMRASSAARKRRRVLAIRYYIRSNGTMNPAAAFWQLTTSVP